MRKSFQRIVSVGLLCVMTITRLMQGKAELLSAKEDMKEYVLTVEDKNVLNQIKSQYKDNIVKDYNTYDVDEKKSIYIGLTESEKKKIESTEGVSDVEKNIKFSANTVPKESVVSRKRAKNADDANWNMQMIGATKNVIKKEKKKDKINVAIMDSGIDVSQDVNVVERVNLVDDEKNIAPFYEDITSHGTSVAGIIADIAPNADLYSVRILDSKNTASLDRVIEGIYWCIDHNIDIINMSFGTKVYSTALEEALKDASDAGILLLAAVGNAGNSSSVEYPAAFDDVIAVGSIDKNAKLTKDSATGDEVELVAPGSQVLTDGAFGGTLVAGGTSLAVAHVTGAAAAIWQKDAKKDSQFVRDILSDCAKNLGDKMEYGNGLVDIKFALEHYKEYEKNYIHPVCESHGTEQTNNLENTGAVKTYDEVELVEGRWNSDGHKTLIDQADQLPNLQVGFTADELLIIKDACAKVDGIENDKENSKKHFREDTDNVLHGRYNYISTMRYLYRVCRGVYTSSNNTSVSYYCNSISYSPHTDYPDWDKIYPENLAKAIVYMTADTTPIASSGNISKQKQKGLRILGMVMHLVGDTYAHKSKVPQDSISNNEIKRDQLKAGASWNEFKTKISQGMMFNKIKNYLGSGYEDNPSFYSYRFDAARDVSNNILRHFAVGLGDVAFPEAMHAARIYENSILCEETKLAYFSKHVRWEYNDKDRAVTVGTISFNPCEGEYINLK